jgi:ferredoxin-NADP reductase
MTTRLDPRDLLDRQLGRVTMYRLVTIVLLVLAAVMIAYTAAGTFHDPFTVQAELVTLAVLVIASYGSNRLLGAAWRIRPHGESAVITGLLLWFLFWPTTDGVDLVWLAGAAVLGNLSKYVLAWRGRHLFNPAAAGAFLVVVLQHVVNRTTTVDPTWWIASETLLPYVAVGAFLVLWRTRRLDLGVLFIVLSGALTVWGLSAGLGSPVDEAIKTTAYSIAIVFIAGFMVSEPLTLPPRRHQQLVVSGVVAIVISYPIWISVLDRTPVDVDGIGVTQELSLLIGNLVAFAFARRRGVTLELEQHRALTPETHELTFRPRRPVTFRPGQYAELTVPHAGVDARGSRRSFSISSPPREDGRVAFALRVPERSSSFKKALLALEPGETIHATGIGGDFLLPSDVSQPLLLVAGGIGITPFLSQLRDDPTRDVVLVYGVPSAGEVPFSPELADVRVVLVGPEKPEDLPAAWTYVDAPVLSVDLIAEAVPDLAGRQAYVSGPPAMVNAVRPGLAKRCKRVRTDYFTGY